MTDELEDTALDILMTVLMASARKPKGLTKTEIMAILAAYEQTALYDLCEAAEYTDEPDTEVKDAPNESEEPTAKDLDPPAIDTI